MTVDAALELLLAYDGRQKITNPTMAKVAKLVLEGKQARALQLKESISNSMKRKPNG